MQFIEIKLLYMFTESCAILFAVGRYAHCITTFQ